MNRWPRWGCDAGAVPLRGVWAGCSCLPLGWRNTDNHQWCRGSRLCGSAHVVSTPNKTPPRGAFRRGGAETEPGRTPLLPVPRGSCEGDGSRKMRQSVGATIRNQGPKRKLRHRDFWCSYRQEKSVRSCVEFKKILYNKPSQKHFTFNLEMYAEITLKPNRNLFQWPSARSLLITICFYTSNKMKIWDKNCSSAWYDATCNWIRLLIVTKGTAISLSDHFSFYILPLFSLLFPIVTFHMVGVFPLCSFFSFPHSGLSVVSCVLSVSSSFFHFSSLD